MFEWLRSLLPHVSLRLCTGLHCRFLEQCRFSPAGGNDASWGRIHLGEVRQYAVATFDGRRSGLFSGRHLFLLDGAAIGQKRLREDSLAPSHA